MISPSHLHLLADPCQQIFEDAGLRRHMEMEWRPPPACCHSSKGLSGERAASSSFTLRGLHDDFFFKPFRLSYSGAKGVSQPLKDEKPVIFIMFNTYERQNMYFKIKWQISNFPTNKRDFWLSQTCNLFCKTILCPLFITCINAPCLNLSI